MNIDVLIADDHQLLLDGISSLLSNEPGISIKSRAANGKEVLELVAQNHYDICLLDISMPEMDGITAARHLINQYPAIKIIVLTTYNDRQIVEEMLEIGVAGYLLKNSSRDELVEAIRKVHGGGLYFSNEVQHTLMQNYIKLKRDGARQKEVTLTQREMEILQLLAQEYTNDRIAEALNISYRTVETHRKNLLQKTNSHNLAGLLKFAYNQQLIK